MPVFTLEEINNNFPDFKKLMDALPGLSARVMGKLGHEGAMELQRMMERGEQGIQFHKMRSDRTSKKSGYRMISYSVGRGGKSVRISSFPLNLFERGRQLRSGTREKARRILRGSLKQRMGSVKDNVIATALEKIINDWIERNGYE